MSDSISNKSVSEILVAASYELDLKIEELLNKGVTSDIQNIERSHQIMTLKEYRKYLEIKAVEYRIDYE